ncbi:MAG TPA: hypothetical protein DEQ77_03790 [Candidatus Omnitrophica bacterium]|nr:hypothetical protein [Candidatus Omnitrophota bacterium]
MSKSCNVLLIYPPHRDKVSASEVPPLGMAYLASFVRKQMGDACILSIWDLNINRISQQQFKEQLRSFDKKPDIIGIGGIVTVFRHFLWISKICKEIFPDALLIAGGSLASTASHLLFKHSPVDVCVKGEGEFTFLEIIQKAAQGSGREGLRNVNGVFLWDVDRQEVIATPARKASFDLDIFGMPAYDLLDMGKYVTDFSGYSRDLPAEIRAAENQHMPIMTSRGCTDRCTFCYRQFAAIRMNSASFVKKHILYLHEHFGVNVFSFIDELFNISEKRINELCDCFMELKNKIPNFYFRAEGRADIINIAMLKRLKEAGCFQIIYGLESGSPKMLQLMKKRLTVEQNRLAVLAAKDAGLHCVPQFLIGLPGETRETLAETIKFIESIDLWSYVCIHKANAYPGSDIYRYALEHGLIRDECAYVSSLADSASYPLQLGKISQKEMMAMVRKYLIKRQARLIFRSHNVMTGIILFIAWLFINISRKLKTAKAKRSVRA